MDWKGWLILGVVLVIIVAFVLTNIPLILPPGGNNTGSLPLSTIRLPPGFHVAVYSGEVPGARSLALSPDGTLFVGTMTEGRVYALPNRPGSYDHPTGVFTIAEGLNEPNGVAFRNGSLYVAEIYRIIRYDDIEANLSSPPEPVVVKAGYPPGGEHGWKFIAFGPDGKLYVPIASPCNICTPPDPLDQTITRMNPDGTGLEVYAEGIRNSVGFDWDPNTGILWFTDNGRDFLGEDIPPDELNRAPEPGMNFGFPYCYDDNVTDPEFPGHSCAGYVPPAVELQAHVAPLGMRFYTGTMFPSEYRDQIFIAEHGSWNRVVPIGYRVALVRLENGTPVGTEVFADGWLQGTGAWGRPVDLQVMPDGSLLVSDDRAGAIYRITYQV
jgi:glucose/arabinose dehydrogenase